MTVICPADPLEAKKATFATAQIKGPVYLRLSTGGTPAVYKHDYEFQVGRAVILKEGCDMAIISTGGIVHEVLQAAEELEGSGISVRLINLHTIKPIDKEVILKAASDTRVILTVEEHSIIGGLGSAVAEVILENNQVPIKFKRMGLNNTFPLGYGSYQDMKEINGLSKRDIVREAKLLLVTKKDKNLGIKV
jgi:transketolase